MALFRQRPSNGGVEDVGYEKSQFSTKVSLSLENYTRLGHITIKIGNRTEYPSFQMVK